MSERLGSARGPAIGRRYFLEVTGAGVSAVALGSAAGLWPGRAGAVEGTVRWVSPRGTIEVLDDYPYWVATEVRLFRRHRDRARARADRGDRDRQAGRPGPGRHGLSLARRVLARPRAGHPVDLGLAHGRLRRLRLRLPQGREAGRRQGDRGQDHPARQRRLAGDRRSDARPDRRRAGQRRLRRGRQPLGPGADAGPGRRGACRGRACARSGRARGSSSTTSSAATSPSSRPTAS